MVFGIAIAIPLFRIKEDPLKQKRISPSLKGNPSKY